MAGDRLIMMSAQLLNVIQSKHLYMLLGISAQSGCHFYSPGVAEKCLLLFNL